MVSLIICAILFIVICVLFHRYQIYKQKGNKKGVGKVMGILIIGILFVICIYLAMLLDTYPLMKEVKDALRGNISAEITIGTPLSNYNIRTHFLENGKETNLDIGETEVFLMRYFTIHNFINGYIWAIYSNKAFDSSGKPFDGSGRIPTKWKIHKENGKWEITEIFEDP